MAISYLKILIGLFVFIAPLNLCGQDSIPENSKQSIPLQDTIRLVRTDTLGIRALQLVDSIQKMEIRWGLQESHAIDSLQQQVFNLQRAQRQILEMRSKIAASSEPDAFKERYEKQLSDLYFQLHAHELAISELVKAGKEDTLKKTSTAGNYLWKATSQQDSIPLGESLKRLLVKQGVSPKQKDFLESTGLLLLFLASILFFLWRRKRAVQANETVGWKKHVFTATESALFLLVLLPVFNPEFTRKYVPVLYLLMLLACLVLSRREGLREQSPKQWFVAIVMYLAFSFVNELSLYSGLMVRLLLIALTLILLTWGTLAYRKNKELISWQKTYRYIYYFYTLLLVSAILFNVFGQLKWSNTLGDTVIMGVIQLFSLNKVGKIILQEAQSRLSTISKNKNSLWYVNQSKAIPMIKKLLFALGALIWGMVMLQHFQIQQNVLQALSAFFGKKHQLGSFEFTLRGIFLFLVIAGIANWIQKNIEELFTSPASWDKRYTAQKGQLGNKITLLRLGIIIAGFILAVTALGVSMNKLTVILGAFSVGIGLGMQNIFNNFVSGIILLFEKPFKIGDLIELGSQKGRVEKIGIRSSILLTEQGSEIIIPNGDLLAGRVVNYNSTDDSLKTQLTLQVAPEMDGARLEEILQQQVTTIKYAMPNMPIELWLSAVTATQKTYLLNCWIKSIYLEPRFKNELIKGLSPHFGPTEIISLT